MKFVIGITMVSSNIDAIISRVKAPKATSSNTIYLSEINLNVVCETLVDYHGKELSESELSELLYESWNQRRRPCGKDSFMRTYRVVFHSWSLYYIENGRFFFTKLIQDYMRKDCTYQEVLQRLCARWQYPKPQQLNQPSGPLRPMVSLLNVMNELQRNGLSNSLSFSECNLFVMFMEKDSDVNDFIDLLKYFRKNKTELINKLLEKSLEIKFDDYESGIKQIIWYLTKSEAIVRNGELIEVA